MAKQLKLGIVTIQPHAQPWCEVLGFIGDNVITHIWDYDRTEAEKFARRYGIKNVCRNPEEMIGEIDAVLIPGGRPIPMGATDSIWAVNEPMGMRPSDHLTLSKPFLQAGIATLIDKPFADTIGEANDIIAAARKGNAILMSCSAHRYEHQLQSAKEIISCGGLGTVRGVSVILGTGPTDLKWYIIHGIEGIATLFGTDVESVTAVSGNSSIDQGGALLPYATFFILKYRNGPLVSMMLLREKAERDRSERLWPLDYTPLPYLTLYYRYSIFGDFDHLDLRIVGKAYYLEQIKAFINGVRTGSQPVSDQEMLSVTRLLLSLPEALATGKNIDPASYR
jgi:predicted dehydrogenase